MSGEPGWRPNVTKDASSTPITQEIISILGTLCQDLGTETNRFLIIPQEHRTGAQQMGALTVLREVSLGLWWGPRRPPCNIWEMRVFLVPSLEHGEPLVVHKDPAQMSPPLWSPFFMLLIIKRLLHATLYAEHVTYCPMQGQVFRFCGAWHWNNLGGLKI